MSKWTSSEINILKENYRTLGRNIPELLKRHSKSGIEHKAVRVGAELTSKNFKTFKPNKKLLNLIDGLLLGDAGLETYNGRTARLHISQRNDRWLWLYNLENYLRKFGIIGSNIYVQHRGEKRKIKGVSTKPQPTLSLQTKFYVGFIDFYNRWYVNNIKTVPEDVSIEPISLAQWYFGDGSLNFQDKYSQIRLSTESFTKENIDKLIKKLHKTYNLNFTKIKHRDRFAMNLYGISQVETFLELIKPYKETCFDYKFNLNPK